jgi:hypothetical protein
MSCIPPIPTDEVEEILNHAEDPDNWIDTEIGIENASKFVLKHEGFEIIYSANYKRNNDDPKYTTLPIRHISFRCSKDYEEQDLRDFVNDTLNQFGFTDPHLTAGKDNTIHYYEQMFQIP